MTPDSGNSGTRQTRRESGITASEHHAVMNLVWQECVLRHSPIEPALANARLPVVGQRSSAASAGGWLLGLEQVRH